MRADRVAVRRDRSFEPAAEALAGGARTLAAIATLALAACSVESADGGPEAGDAAADGYFTSEDVNTVFIEEMTWSEVRDAIDRGATTVILPTAGTEQNGPHMVTGKHRYIIEEASDRIARELGDALVAPTVTYVPEGGVDPPSGHMRYAGTITLPNEFFMKLVEYAARSFRAHGFTDIAFIGDSGGNQRGMEAVATMLNEEWGGEGSRVHFIGDYYANNGFRDWLVEQGEVPDSIGGHAGISDTSILLYVEPRHIRQDKLAPGGGFDGSGVSGNPTRASAEYGEVGMRMRVDAAVRQIRAARGSR
ncbi:MAG: creatininase family protein [Gemmatimonadetes bacterium]|nr:creatininase family protein [Gemmatimonadota bacterium]